jgi:hypothetical protein
MGLAGAMNQQSLSAQISALAMVVRKSTPHTLRSAGFAYRNSEAELLKSQLTAALRTLEQLQGDRQ